MSRSQSIRPAIGGLVLLFASGCSQQTAAPPAVPEVGVVTLRAEPVLISSDHPGRIVAAETSEVRPQVDGIIRRRYFEEGSTVHAGQILYQIEDAPYRAAVASAEGNLATASASIRSTGLQAERYGRLLAMKGVSQQDADNAAASAQEARATAQARRAEMQSARISLGFTQIRAPISGRISRSLITVGALAQTGQTSPLATIQNIGNVFVDVTVPASELLDIQDAIRGGGLSREGAARAGLILPNGKTYPIEGKLEFSEASVDETSGNVTVRARFDNPDGVLLPGMYVRARLIQGTRRRAILAPQQGVTRNERGEAVALVVGAGNKVEQRPITTAGQIGDRWIVTSGLNAGDRLIVEGLLNAHPGQKATPRPPEQITLGDRKAAQR